MGVQYIPPSKNKAEQISIRDEKNNYKNKNLEGVLDEVATQINTMENKQNCVSINVLFPPIPLNPLKNDGITDNSPLLRNIINYIINNGKNGVIIFPYGVYYFANQITINDSNLNLNLIGQNSEIKLKEASSTDSFMYIQNINNYYIQDFYFTSTDLSQTLTIQVNNANKIYMNNIKVYNVGSALKINFNYNYDNQYLVNQLITNNIEGTKVKHLMHICNINSWEGYNLKANIGTTKSDSGLPTVCFYMRPRCNNVNLSNIYVENCTGDVFHFNRVDYTLPNDNAKPPFNTVGYTDNNIKINNITVKNFGNLVGFNSQTNDISFNNVTCINQISDSRGLIHAFEGQCDNISISNFKFENIQRLILLEHVDGGNTNTHRDFGTIKLINGTVDGEFKKGSSIYGKIKSYTLDNIIFNNIDGNLALGAIVSRFYNQIDVIKLTNLIFNLSGNHTRVCELFRFTHIGKVYANNIIINRILNTTKINIFSTYGVTDVSKIKIFSNNVFAYNLGTDGTLYYGDNSVIIKSNCYLNDVINS